MEIFDAHIHYDLMNKEGLSCYIQQKDIIGLNLIINTNEEAIEVLHNKDFIKTEKTLCFTLLWDYRLENIKEIQLLRNKLNKNIAVKIYPRLQRLTKDDIQILCDSLEKITFSHIVVDAFEVGEELQNYISLDLIIELSKRYPSKKIVVAHAGGYRCIEYLMILKNLHNIFYDISFTINYLFFSSVRFDLFHLIYWKRDKILFGTDFPEYSLDETMDHFLQITDKMDGKNEIRKLVLIDNYRNNFQEE